MGRWTWPSAVRRTMLQRFLGSCRRQAWRSSSWSVVVAWAPLSRWARASRGSGLEQGEAESGETGQHEQTLQMWSWSTSTISEAVGQESVSIWTEARPRRWSGNSSMMSSSLGQGSKREGRDQSRVQFQQGWERQGRGELEERALAK